MVTTNEIKHINEVIVNLANLNGQLAHYNELYKDATSESEQKRLAKIIESKLRSIAEVAEALKGFISRQKNGNIDFLIWGLCKA